MGRRQHLHWDEWPQDIPQSSPVGCERLACHIHLPMRRGFGVLSLRLIGCCEGRAVRAQGLLSLWLSSGDRGPRGKRVSAARCTVLRIGHYRVLNSLPVCNYIPLQIMIFLGAKMRVESWDLQRRRHRGKPGGSCRLDMFISLPPLPVWRLKLMPTLRLPLWPPLFTCCGQSGA